MLFQYLFKNISNLVEIWTSLGVEFHNIHHCFFYSIKSMTSLIVFLVTLILHRHVRIGYSISLTVDALQDC